MSEVLRVPLSIAAFWRFYLLIPDSYNSLEIPNIETISTSTADQVMHPAQAFIMTIHTKPRTIARKADPRMNLEQILMSSMAD